ncbi:hypothetical protein QEK78_004604 [Stenotrophomonas maltophilia]|nr:hypothetical protein [Stenotrophomonas maltophilia]EKU9978693.1 hypothetical protein [Stenotrophomonas maltophilia]KMU64772.1 hypothetical protein STRNTR1_2430 [Stenotrophomonas maltophilia]HDS1827855.1 hypothetical protein [Stenotrophomonas maltophilia]HDS1829320.1 hypothetical protein [Stenotrophomonas maltophilia]
MTLIRALPSLADTDRPRNASVREQLQHEQLQQLEEVAREEIRELQQLADARPGPSRADEALLGLAWDLGLDGNSL